MNTDTVRWTVGGCMLVALLWTGGCASMESPRMLSAQALPVPVEPLPPRAELGERVVSAVRPDFTTNSADRLMVYDASMTLLVPDIGGTLDRLRAMASGMQGYMQDMSERLITLRIPAAQFNEAIRQVEKLGEVTSLEIKGLDVTEEMMDLDVRLKNTEEVRARLVKLLDKGGKVEDLLSVEKELARVTESLELLKGKIQYLRNSVVYSTLRVHLNTPLPQRDLEEVIPFAWVRGLASDILLPARANFSPEWHLFSWLKLDLPDAYVKLHEGDNSTRAMSGDGVMLLVKREPNFEGGTLDFWARIVRRWLVASKVIVIAEEKDVTLDTGVAGKLVVGTKTLGRKDHRYIVALIVNQDYVYTFECWGPAEYVAKDQAALEKMVKSMRVKR